MADMYKQRLIKYGNISDAIEYMRKHGLVDDKTLASIVMNYDVTKQDQPAVEKIILQDIPEFNKHFRLEVTNSKTEKRFTKPFNKYDNIKQLLLYTSLTYYQTEKDKTANVGLSVSSARSATTAMRFVEELEKENKKPFWEFDSDEIKQTYVEMAKAGYTPHTIVTKISLLIKMQDNLRLLAAQYPEVSMKIADEGEWRRAAHAPTKKKPKTHVVRKVKRYFYTKDTIYKALESTEPRYSVIALLIYRGVRFPVRDDTSDNEMGSIKVGDFAGNVLTIHGNYPRSIHFTDYEMRFIHDLMRDVDKSEYLLRPDKLANRSRPREPLKRWALSQKRLKRVGDSMGIPMRYYAIRQSGELEFIENYFHENKEKLDAMTAGMPPFTREREQLIAALIKCFEQFGIAKKGELTREDFYRTSKNKERLQAFAVLKKQFDLALAKRAGDKSTEEESVKEDEKK